MQLFFANHFAGNKITLDESESFHCISVLRHNEGHVIKLIDGKGFFYEGKIISANKKKCEVEIIRSLPDENKRDYYLHIAISPLKNADRFEWFLEKAAEIGVDEITPLICHRTEKKKVNHERCNKILIASIKQSVKATLPVLNKEVVFDELVRQNSSAEKFIAHCLESPKKQILEIKGNKKNILFLIGPEGDFTEEEIQRAAQNKFSSVSLGKSRLRTETAAIYICAALSMT